MNSFGDEHILKLRAIDGILICIGIIILMGLIFKSASFASASSDAALDAHHFEYHFDDCGILEVEPRVSLKEKLSDMCILDDDVCTGYDDYVDPYYIDLTDDEIDMLAALIYLEARGESIECQRGVCSVVLNRYTTGKYDSIEDVIYEKKQFSTAKNIAKTTPSKTQYEVIDYVLTNGPTIPEYVIYFRASHYHTFSDAKDYIIMDHTYFSESRKLKKKLDKQEGADDSSN